jgi:beta-glucuronidase
VVQGSADPGEGESGFEGDDRAAQEQALRRHVQRRERAPTDWEEAAEFVRQLAEYVRSLDPTRPVTFASHRHSRDRALGFADVISLNVYFGWYSEWGSIEEGVRRMLEELKRVHEMHPDKPVLLAEFGADAVAGVH